MNGKDNYNDPLERLFQKKADEYNIPYREEDWQNLEKKLDIRDMQLAYRRKVRLLAAASILILSLLGYFTYENHNRINELNQQLSENSVEGTEQTQPNGTIFSERDERSVEEPEHEISNETSVDDELRSAETPDQQPGLTEQTADTDFESDFIDREPLTRFEQIPERTEIVKNYELAGLFYPDRESVTPVIKEKTRALMDYTTVQQSDQRILASVLKDTDNFDGDQFLAAGSDQKHEMSRFSVALLASPDISTAGGISNFDDPGYKFGVMAEYALTNNLALQAGAAVGKVNYSASGNSYNPPGYWNQGVIPDETSAICFIFDIPVNLKYNFLDFSSSRIYATAGISSYIMLNEEYRFRYKQNNYSQEQYFNEATGTPHWLSNAGFSIGYELDVHDNWSLRAEPFLKVPIRGVGWGNVDLYSMGSFVSLNYNFSR